jgi:hypothetical protein
MLAQMGIIFCCCCSGQQTVDLRVLWQELKWQHIFEELNFTSKEIGDLYGFYCRKITKNFHEMISISKLLNELNIKENAFISKVFLVFENFHKILEKRMLGKVTSPLKREINFYEFVLVLWHFCSLTEDSLSKYSTFG